MTAGRRTLAEVDDLSRDVRRHAVEACGEDALHARIILTGQDAREPASEGRRTTRGMHGTPRALTTFAYIIIRRSPKGDGAAPRATRVRNAAR